MTEAYSVRVGGEWVRVIPVIVNGETWWTDEARTVARSTPNEVNDALVAAHGRRIGAFLEFGAA